MGYKISVENVPLDSSDLQKGYKDPKVSLSWNRPLATMTGSNPDSIKYTLRTFGAFMADAASPQYSRIVGQMVAEAPGQQATSTLKQ